MELFPGLCLWPRNNRLDFGADPDYDPDPGFGLRSASDLGPTDLHEFFTRGMSRCEDQSNFGDDTVYDPDQRSGLRILITAEVCNL